MHLTFAASEALVAFMVDGKPATANQAITLANILNDHPNIKAMIQRDFAVAEGSGEYKRLHHKQI